TLTNCAAARQAVQRDERPEPESVQVLENGVDLDRFLDIEESFWYGRRVGVVANLRHVKGLDIFIAAARLVLATVPDATFHIAGEGEERPRLERQIARLGLAG